MLNCRWPFTHHVTQLSITRLSWAVKTYNGDAYMLNPIGLSATCSFYLTSRKLLARQPLFTHHFIWNALNKLLLSPLKQYYLWICFILMFLVIVPSNQICTTLQWFLLRQTHAENMKDLTWFTCLTEAFIFTLEATDFNSLSPNFSESLIYVSLSWAIWLTRGFKKLPPHQKGIELCTCLHVSRLSSRNLGHRSTNMAEEAAGVNASGAVRRAHIHKHAALGQYFSLLAGS